MRRLLDFIWTYLTKQDVLAAVSDVIDWSTIHFFSPHNQVYSVTMILTKYPNRLLSFLKETSNWSTVLLRLSHTLNSCPSLKILPNLHSILVEWSFYLFVKCLIFVVDKVHVIAAKKRGKEINEIAWMDILREVSNAVDSCITLPYCYKGQ